MGDPWESREAIAPSREHGAKIDAVDASITVQVVINIAGSLKTVNAVAGLATALTQAPIQGVWYLQSYQPAKASCGAARRPYKETTARLGGLLDATRENKLITPHGRSAIRTSNC